MDEVGLLDLRHSAIRVLSRTSGVCVKMAWKCLKANIARILLLFRGGDTVDPITCMTSIIHWPNQKRTEWNRWKCLTNMRSLN